MSMIRRMAAAALVFAVAFGRPAAAAPSNPRAPRSESHAQAVVVDAKRMQATEDLMDAAARDDIVAARAALARGAYLNHKGREGKAAIHLAAEAATGAVLAWLLERRAVVDLRARGRRTALMFAVGAGRLDNVRTLLERGARPDLVDADAHDALYYAAERGVRAIVDALLDAGVPCSRPVPSGEGVLEAAAEGGHVDALTTLLERCPASPRRTELLMTAAAKGHPDSVRSLLAAGFDPNLRDAYGDTWLMIACANGAAEVVRILIGAGADVGLAGADGSGAVHRAVRAARPEAVLDILLEAGISVDARITAAPRRRGWTPLLVAAVEGSPAAVSALIERRADVNASSLRGRTALLLAAWLRRHDVVSALLRAGADAGVADATMLTPSLAASLSGDVRLGRGLREWALRRAR